jgi:hypothetical protein
MMVLVHVAHNKILATKEKATVTRTMIARSIWFAEKAIAFLT